MRWLGPPPRQMAVGVEVIVCKTCGRHFDCFPRAELAATAKDSPCRTGGPEGENY